MDPDELAGFLKRAKSMLAVGDIIVSVDGRPVAVVAYDFTIMAGSMGEVNEQKVTRLRDLVLRFQEARPVPQGIIATFGSISGRGRLAPPVLFAQPVGRAHSNDPAPEPQSTGPLKGGFSPHFFQLSVAQSFPMN